MSSFGQAAYPRRPEGPLTQRAREHWPALTLAGAAAVLLAAGLVLLGVMLEGSGRSPSQGRQLATARGQVRGLSAQLAAAQRTQTTTAGALTVARSRLRAQNAALKSADGKLAAARSCERSRHPRRCLRATLGR